jgi:hypothetical protein
VRIIRDSGFTGDLCPPVKTPFAGWMIANSAERIAFIIAAAAAGIGGNARCRWNAIAMTHSRALAGWPGGVGQGGWAILPGES